MRYYQTVTFMENGVGHQEIPSSREVMLINEGAVRFEYRFPKPTFYYTKTQYLFEFCFKPPNIPSVYKHVSKTGKLTE